jgi:hypothetical protein
MVEFREVVHEEFERTRAKQGEWRDIEARVIGLRVPEDLWPLGRDGHPLTLAALLRNAGFRAYRSDPGGKWSLGERADGTPARSPFMVAAPEAPAWAVRAELARTTGWITSDQRRAGERVEHGPSNPEDEED